MNQNLMIQTDTKRTFSGVVYKKTIGNYSVCTGERILSCRLAPRIRRQFAGFAADLGDSRGKVPRFTTNDDTDPVAIGDEVRFILASEAEGLIVEVLPRRNKLARRTAVPMPSARPFEQVIVANVDLVIPVFSVAEPAPRWNMLDRYLVSAESAGLKSLICINKVDLVNGNGEIEEAVEDYREIGYPVSLTSAVTGEGLGELRQALTGRISVFLGKSGVGKSSLLNALDPNLGLPVKEVNRKSGKGKHTTTNPELLPLKYGGAVIDTPGVREFGLWDTDPDELAFLFLEMRPYLGRCRFGLDCRHDEEPGCAIRRAVTDGKISPRRYQNYLRLREDCQ
jgi:ribosome biogenesis GTPase